MHPDHLLQFAHRIMDEAEGRARTARLARDARARRRAARAASRTARRNPPRSPAHPSELVGQHREVLPDGDAAQRHIVDDGHRQPQPGRP